MAEDKTGARRDWFGKQLGMTIVWAGAALVLVTVVLAFFGVGGVGIGVLGLVAIAVGFLVDGRKKRSLSASARIGQVGSSGPSDPILRELVSIKRYMGWGVFVIGLILSIQTFLLLF